MQVKKNRYRCTVTDIVATENEWKEAFKEYIELYELAESDFKWDDFLKLEK